MSPIKIGIVGYGGSARIYNLPYIIGNPRYEIYAFLQRAKAPASKEPGKHCTIDYPQAKHYSDADGFFADSSIELVIVSTHPDSHAEFAKKALNAGKHVVVEKPFTRTSAEAGELIALAKKQGKHIFPYQNRRYDGDFRTLEYLLDPARKALGEVTEAEIHYDMQGPPPVSWFGDQPYKPGDGLLFGLGSHTFDQALELFGRPSTITAFLKVLRGVESDIEDSFTVILQYADRPLLVTVKTTLISPIKDQLKFLVRGTKGSYLKFGTDAQENQTLGGLKSTDSKFGHEDEHTWGTLSTYEQFEPQTSKQTYDDQTKLWIGKYPSLPGDNRGYYEQVADVLLDGAEPIVKAQQSRDGIRLIELARESWKQGRSITWSDSDAD